MPWQEIALDRQLSHVDGVLCHSEALTSTARQNGKSTGGMRALIGWWLTEMCKIRGEPQNVLAVANKLEVGSRIMFRPLVPIMESMYGAKVVQSFGREEMTLECGCTLVLQSDTPSCGHSLTNDLVVVEELWDISQVAYDDGMVPTTVATFSPLVSSWSTAGTQRSVVMRRLRDVGIAAMDAGEPGSVCLSSWELPRGVDPWDFRWWRYANPALGRTITLERLRGLAVSAKPEAFLRGHLNRWVPTDKPWLPMGAFDKMRWPGVAA